MLEIRMLLIFILLGMTLYYIYKMYSFNSFIITKCEKNIIDGVEDNFENINDNLNNMNDNLNNINDKFDNVDDKFNEIENKLQSVEDLINVRLEVCYKKVNDIYSLQNKVNEITKMNNQSINRQFNQYDEENYEPENNKQNNVYNSLETSISPESKVDKLHNKCFIKHNNTKNQDREMFYMSSINKNDNPSRNNLSKTSTEPELIKETNFYKKNIKGSSSSSNSSTPTNTKNLSKKSTSSKINLYVNTSDSKNNIDIEQNCLNQKNIVDSDNNNLSVNLYKNNKKTNLRIVKDNISLSNQTNLEGFINSLPEEAIDNFFQKNKSSET
jgi:hypothetical protein